MTYSIIKISKRVGELDFVIFIHYCTGSFLLLLFAVIVTVLVIVVVVFVYFVVMTCVCLEASLQGEMADEPPTLIKEDILPVSAQVIK